MPPITRTAPIIGTLGRRRRPVRSIRFARDAPRTPPQSPGEGRLPPVRVRLRSRQKPEHVASPLVSILRKSRSDGSLSGFRSEPLESLTLRSFAIGSFSRRSIAYFCAPATLSPFQWRALSSFRAQRWRHVTSADASISRGFGTPNNLSRRPENDRRAELARDAKIAWAQLGFLRTPKIDLDASGTFARRLRDVIYRGGGVEPRAASFGGSGASASARR